MLFSDLGGKTLWVSGSIHSPTNSSDDPAVIMPNLFFKITKLVLSNEV